MRSPLALPPLLIGCVTLFPKHVLGIPLTNYYYVFRAPPTSSPTLSPSHRPSARPSSKPSGRPSAAPSVQPSSSPTSSPSISPSSQPSWQPSSQPTTNPTSSPSALPTSWPSSQPSGRPSVSPSSQPTAHPSSQPTGRPSVSPSSQPTAHLSSSPSFQSLEQNQSSTSFLRTQDNAENSGENSTSIAMIIFFIGVLLTFAGVGFFLVKRSRSRDASDDNYDIDDYDVEDILAEIQDDDGIFDIEMPTVDEDPEPPSDLKKKKDDSSESKQRSKRDDRNQTKSSRSDDIIGEVDGDDAAEDEGLDEHGSKRRKRKSNRKHSRRRDETGHDKEDNDDDASEDGLDEQESRRRRRRGGRKRKGGKTDDFEHDEISNRVKSKSSKADRKGGKAKSMSRKAKTRQSDVDISVIDSSSTSGFNHYPEENDIVSVAYSEEQTATLYTQEVDETIAEPASTTSWRKYKRDETEYVSDDDDNDDDSSEDDELDEYRRRTRENDRKHSRDGFKNDEKPIRVKSKSRKAKNMLNKAKRISRKGKTRQSNVYDDSSSSSDSFDPYPGGIGVESVADTVSLPSRFDEQTATLYTKEGDETIAGTASIFGGLSALTMSYSQFGGLSTAFEESVSAASGAISGAASYISQEVETVWSDQRSAATPPQSYRQRNIGSKRLFRKPWRRHLSTVDSEASDEDEDSQDADTMYAEETANTYSSDESSGAYSFASM